MSQQLILIIMGAAFVVLGIALIFWGRVEETRYYTNIARRFDVREFIERMPFRPEPGSLRVGGRIALAVGLVLLLAGAVVWYLRVVLP